MVIRGIWCRSHCELGDLWELELPGKIGIWAVERELIGGALKSLAIPPTRRTEAVGMRPGSSAAIEEEERVH